MSDGAFFYRNLGDALIGLCAPYVDETLYTGNKDYLKLFETPDNKLHCKEREYNNLHFGGIENGSHNE